MIVAVGSLPPCASITSTAAPIRVRMPSRPIRPGLMPTPSSRTSLPRTSSAPTMKNAAEEKSPGTRDRAELQPLRGLHRGPGRGQLAVNRHRGAGGLGAHAGAGGAQHPLGVVAGGPLLDHAGRPLGVEPSQQHARLHLGRGNRQPVLDPAQRRPAHAQRRAPVTRLDVGAHQPQRLGDPVDGPAADRLVAVECPLALGLAGEQPGQQAQERARVADVDLRGRGAAEAHPRDRHRRRTVAAPELIDSGPELQDGVRARGRVGGEQEVLDPGLALGDSRRATRRGARSTCRAAA